MSCLIFLCDDEAAVLAGSRVARLCDALSHAVLNRVQDRCVRMPIPSRPLHVAALLQIWSLDHRAREVIDAAGELGLERYYEVERQILLPPAALPGAIKRMSLLERATGLDPSQFREIWRESHGPRVARRADALLGYCQNYVLARSPGAPPCDGLTELWFPDVETMEAVLPSAPSEPEALTALAGSFIGRISTLLLTEVRLK
ncbi:MAG: EthD domain-containing protein [Cereibacter sp.]